MDTPDVIVIGGGLAGLTAAATAALRGRDVVLVEARSHEGGRAHTVERDGFRFNEGAHALYAGGPGIQVLRQLGVDPKGSPPPVSGWGVRDGQLKRLPTGPIDSMRTSLVSVRGKAQIGRVLLQPRRALDTPMANKSMQQWLDEQFTDRNARDFVAILSRVATFCGDLDQLDAEAAVRQLVAAAQSGVLYLDGGWEQLVDGLRTAATSAGVRILRDRKAIVVEREAGSLVVSTTEGPMVARSIVLAVGGPDACSSIIGDRSATIGRWAAESRPVHVAALDLALRRVSVPEQRFVLGLDEPTYLSVHTPYADLAPESGGAVVHLLWYGDPGHDPRPELERLMDLAQPGWRDEVVAEQYGRMRTVTHSRPEPGRGLDARPDVAVDDLPGVFVAGDWVGAVGMLSDAAISSGRAAGRAAADEVARTQTAVAGAS
jgi:phytoene dehydrogenase-like protein